MTPLAFFNAPAATNLRSPTTSNTVTFTSSLAKESVLEGGEALASLLFTFTQLITAIIYAAHYL